MAAPVDAAPPCPLCGALNEDVLWRDDLCRVILVDDADYPGFCRVILNRHVAEMTDLDGLERARLMTVVFAVEAALREVLRPTKINLASLGNMVPHVHWHVIPRFADDRHFPEAIWAAPKRPGSARRLDSGLRPGLLEALARHLPG
jgi:diadenosine tetraphosphate (Ap4A) HIT family hydrolase